jgi:capsular exopolysaccharide synthesis family protein
MTPVPIAPATGTPVLAAMMPTLPPALSADSTGGAVFQAVKRRWLRAVLAGALAAALAAAAVWYLMPADYTAQALLHVASRPPRSFFAAHENSDDFANYQRTQAALVKSKLVLHAALREPAVAALDEVHQRSDPAGWLAKQLVVDTTLAPEILRVSLNGSNPEELPVIVNAVVQAYLREVADKDQVKVQTRIDQLQDNHRRHADILRRKRGLLGDLEQTLGVEDPQTLTLLWQAALQKLGEAEKEHLAAKLALKTTQLELDAERAKQKKPAAIVITEAAIDEYLKQDLGYQKLHATLSQLVDELEQTRSRASVAVHDDVLGGPRERVAAAQRALAARRREARPLAEAELRTRAVEESKANRARLEGLVLLRREQEQALADEVQKLQRDVQRRRAGFKQPEHPTADLDSQRDEVAQEENILKKIGDQLDGLKAEPVVPSRVTLLEPADVPDVPTLERKIKFTAAAGASAFALLFLGVTWREFRVRKVYAPDDVVRGLGMNLFGTLPALPLSARRAGAEARPGLHPSWQARMNEAVDAVRTQFLHAAFQDSLRVLLLTSATEGEGKTSLASHLAASLARAGRKTLLIDGDLRNPGAHQQFALPLSPGFSDVLRGEIQVEEAIRATPIARLWSLPAGHWDSEAVAGLTQERIRTTFTFLKDRYDFIVVDSSPVLPVADTLALAQVSDGVILSVMRDVSRLPLIYAAYQRLAALGVRMLGTVVIGTTDDVYGSVRTYSTPTVPVDALPNGSSR